MIGVSKVTFPDKRLARLFSLASILINVAWQKHRWIIHPVFAFLLTRLIVFGAAYIGDVLLPTDPGHWNPTPESPFLSLWAKWDSQWYHSIIQEGYWFRPGQHSSVAFFPLYPLVVSTLISLSSINPSSGGVLVSNVAFFVALTLLYKLADLEFGDRGTAQRAVYYVCVFPTSFFFSAVYTESVFLLFSVAAIYFARRRLWIWAALMGMLASATRSVGILTWGLVMWEWLRVHGWTLETIHRRAAWVNLWRGVKRDWFQMLILGAIPLGLISYMVFLRVNFRDPVAFATVQSAWGRQNIGPWAVVARDLDHVLQQDLNRGNLARLLNLSALMAALAMSPAVWRRLGAGYAIYALLLILIPASSASQSIIRYVLVSFPIFMVMGNWGRNMVFDRIVTVSFAVLLGALTTVFANWFFVA